jgi:hypothetical protein
MASKSQQFTLHPALGGLDVSSDPSILDPNFLTAANNVEYLEGGQRRKRGGTAVYSTNLPSSSGSSTGTNTFLPANSNPQPVRALADFWTYGTTITPTQSILAVAGKSIFASTGSGSWTPISVTSSFGSTGSVNTTITLAGGYAVVNDPIGTELPVAVTSALALKAFNSTGMASLPIYTAATYHLNRLFTGGLSTAPSAVNYTAANNIFDSTGTDTGSFTVAIGDGDQVMGLSQPFYGSVYVWKGPQFGSVWQLSGNTPSVFALAEVAHGAPLLNPKALVSTPTDIYWLSNYGIHSLQTTVKFGNVDQAFLSLPIQRLWRDRIISRSDLSKAWGGWAPDRNIVFWAVTPSGSTNAVWLLVYNYALSDPKPGGKKFWSIWVFPNGLTCGGTVLTPAAVDPTHGGDPHMWFGESDGQVYIANQDASDSQFNDAGAAYTFTIQTPVISRYPAQTPTPETAEKLNRTVTTYFNPHTPGATAQLTVTVDRRQQTYTVDLTGGGAKFDIDAFWDIALFAGNDFNYFETPIEDRGRSITLRYDQASLNTDCEIFGYSVRYDPAETIPQEQS